MGKSSDIFKMIENKDLYTPKEIAKMIGHIVEYSLKLNHYVGFGCKKELKKSLLYCARETKKNVPENVRCELGEGLDNLIQELGGINDTK